MMLSRNYQKVNGSVVSKGAMNSFNPLTTNALHHVETGGLIFFCKSIDLFLYEGEHWSLMS